MAICSKRVWLEGSSSFRYHAYFILSHVFLNKFVSFANRGPFSIQSSETYSTDVDVDDDDVRAPSDIPQKGYEHSLIV